MHELEGVVLKDGMQIEDKKLVRADLRPGQIVELVGEKSVNLTEREWLKFSLEYEYVVGLFEQFITELNGDRVRGFLPLTPYWLTANRANIALLGNWNVGDVGALHQ